MSKSVPADQQKLLIRDGIESPVKFGELHRARKILKVFNRIINRMSGFIQLTEKEQKEAGVYRGLHRYD